MTPHSLIPWSRVLIEVLVVAQLAEKSPAFHGIQGLTRRNTSTIALQAVVGDEKGA
jgi:hypothetical protein